MITACSAVMAEDAMPNVIPRPETYVLSRNTPTKKPAVTIKHEKSIRMDGRACKKIYDVTTVRGRTRPRATW
jgi:hypothetical protein